MPAPRKYTDEQLARITAATKAELNPLAEEWGIPVNTLISKRQEARSGVTRAMRYHAALARKREETRRHAPGAQFARPPWFEEDLALMSRARR